MRRPPEARCNAACDSGSPGTRGLTEVRRDLPGYAGSGGFSRSDSLRPGRPRHGISDSLERYDDKYPKATACLARDRDELLAFYDFPAAHWTHLRTTNVIESAFAPIRH